MTLLSDVEASLLAALERAFPNSGLADPALRPSEFADFQANLAMGLGKRVGRPPREVAQAVAAELEGDAVVQAVSVAGPGFLNLTIANAALDRALAMLASGLEEELLSTRRQTVVIDYSAPNVAKELHVGHLRSSVIGDALARIMEARGHSVIRQNHLGDWGTPFGMLIEHLVDLGEAASDSVSDLTAFYQAARKKFDADPGFADRARQRVVFLQSGDAATVALWNKLCGVSRRYFAEVYSKLKVTLRDEDIAGESTYNAALPGTVEALRELGLLVESDGALCVFPHGFRNKEGDPLPLIVRKKDGGYGYAATDLAAIRHRFSKLAADRVLYVVGSPQSQHLAMVFAVAKAAGWVAENQRVEHVAFGSVLGANKKMLATREGGSVRLVELLDEARVRAKHVVEERGRDLTEPEREAVADAVGVGAIKYADLSNDRIKDYVFDWDRMLATEGNAAPYLMYAHARTCSILRKAPSDAARLPFLVSEKAERELAFKLLGFVDAVREVEATLEPHRLATQLYETAICFSSFYKNCPVLSAAEPERASRLALTELTARVLHKGLNLLGLDAPEKM